MAILTVTDSIFLYPSHSSNACISYVFTFYLFTFCCLSVFVIFGITLYVDSTGECVRYLLFLVLLVCVHIAFCSFISYFQICLCLQCECDLFINEHVWCIAMCFFYKYADDINEKRFCHKTYDYIVAH